MLIGLLEDDALQRDLYRVYLETAGHTCRAFDTSRAFCDALRQASYDLLVIDWVLPDGLGDQVIRFARDELALTIPIVVLTMRDDEPNIVMALRGGADDYIVKPPRPMELAARIDALARRSRASLPKVIHAGPYGIDLASRQITVDGQVADLTGKEFDLAVHLFHRVGRLMSRQQLLDDVWGIQADIDTRTVDTHISRVRRKLQISPKRGYQLSSIYGYGYRLEKV